MTWTPNLSKDFSEDFRPLIQGRITYAPPFWPEGIFEERGGGVIFRTPPRQEFHTPPSFVHPPTPRRVFSGVGGVYLNSETSLILLLHKHRREAALSVHSSAEGFGTSVDGCQDRKVCSFYIVSPTRWSSGQACSFLSSSSVSAKLLCPCAFAEIEQHGMKSHEQVGRLTNCFCSE